MFQSKWKNPSKTRTYYSWKAMRRRCSDPKSIGWAHYGGRGIKVCDRWANDYDAFFEDMGPCPDGMTIERIDNDGNYEPSNCRWASRKEQSRNTRSNHLIEYEGRTQSLTDWAEELGISVSGIDYRIRSGMPVDQVLTSTRRRVDEAPHGSISRYTNRKCRCIECKSAWREYTRSRRSKNGRQ